jgi:hypothetical protein
MYIDNLTIAGFISCIAGLAFVIANSLYRRADAHCPKRRAAPDQA